MITTYIIGVLMLNSMLMLWFESPLKSSLAKIFLRKEMSNLEFDDYIFMKSKILSKLLSCWICLSFWLSFVIGFLLTFSITWGFLCFFTYPSLCYMFAAFVKR